MMNNTILKGIIIILLLALIRVGFRYAELKSIVIQYQETCEEMQNINDGLIALNNELIREIEEDIRNAGNGTE